MKVLYHDAVSTDRLYHDSEHEIIWNECTLRGEIHLDTESDDWIVELYEKDYDSWGKIFTDVVHGDYDTAADLLEKITREKIHKEMS